MRVALQFSASQCSAILGISLVLQCHASQAIAQIAQTEVSSLASPPLQSVCHIATRRSPAVIFRRAYDGSAALYRGRYLITAAHNVFSPFYNPIVSLRVACGATAPTDGEHVDIPVSSIRVASDYNWVPRKRFDRDFAVIRLPEPIGSEGFQLRYVQASQIPVHIAGFPDDGRRSSRMNGQRMFSGSGTAVASADSPFLNYDVSTEGGNSGGPIWTFVDGSPVLVGIHISPSRARRVDDEFIRVVGEMIQSLERQ